MKYLILLIAIAVTGGATPQALRAQPAPEPAPLEQPCEPRSCRDGIYGIKSLTVDGQQVTLRQLLRHKPTHQVKLVELEQRIAQIERVQAALLRERIREGQYHVEEMELLVRAKFPQAQVIEFEMGRVEDPEATEDDPAPTPEPEPISSTRIFIQPAPASDDSDLIRATAEADPDPSGSAILAEATPPK